MPCVVLLSVVRPRRLVHPDAVEHFVQADGLPCLHCMRRCVHAMQTGGCIASWRGRCVTDIAAEAVLDGCDRALHELPFAARRGRDPVPAAAVNR